jgi:hypothetical protein
MSIAPLHCPRCGRAMSNALLHPFCARALDLEPPRFCVMCGRRMKVQVVPTGWSAECVEHGVSTGGTAPVTPQQAS